MCEFKMFLNGERVFEDVIYAKVAEDHIYLRDVLGRSKEIPNSKIIEVDVNSERLIIARIEDRKQVPAQWTIVFWFWCQLILFPYQSVS